MFGFNSIMETNIFIRANVNLIHKLGKDHVIALQDLTAPKWSFCQNNSDISLLPLTKHITEECNDDIPLIALCILSISAKFAQSSDHKLTGTWLAMQNKVAEKFHLFCLNRKNQA